MTAPEVIERQLTPLTRAAPWNRGKLIGQNPPLKLREVWAIRIRLQITQRLRDLVMFNLAKQAPRL
jgi:hypothetical protein